ncbi:hypothetical protein [Paenibacillus sp. y28]|uniref:hypothetical protein n=1 Tax=Paenibacillus sp. y28 TaxID=3129110 RepID=UPI00301A19DB
MPMNKKIRKPAATKSVKPAAAKARKPAAKVRQAAANPMVKKAMAIRAAALRPKARRRVGPKQVDLTGTWTGSDNNTYYFNQTAANVLWFAGLNNNGQVTSVYRGTIQDDEVTIVGQYSTVRLATPRNGNLRLNIESATSVTKVSQTGGFTFPASWAKV